MIDSITRITLNLQETNTMVSISAKRGDTGRKLLIHLSDGSIPYHISDDCYATFTAKKPDGTKINNACTIENNVIEYEFTEQTCTAVGTMKAEIRLYGADDKMITSACFLVNVYDTVFRDGDEVGSETEMNTLDDLILRANAFLNETGKLLRWKGNWDSETEYEANDLVLHEEVLYVAEEAIAAGTAPGSEEVTAWVPIAGMGTGNGGEVVGIASVKQTTTTSASGGLNVVTVTLTDGTESRIQIRNGQPGAAIQGPQGPAGPMGPQGLRGFTGATGPQGPAGDDYVLTDADKAEIAEMAADLVEVPEHSGGNAEDGFSPIATVTQTASGAVISITDKDGTTTATITNGKGGKDGADGQPGKDGANGKDGTSATHSWNGTVLTITSASGTSSADLKGAKGDKGDNAYIWIKYASKKPTSSSVSLGDVPDEWIGIYTGTSSTAPTSYSSYKWYQIKGEKGDTGDPATLTSSTVSYQVGDSGTVIPSGSWHSNPPVVPQGKFLWTRIMLQFNTGSPVTSYSVAWMGVDGSGSVASVNNIGPDENGNIEVTADALGALSKKGGTMEGEINMNGQAITGLNEPKSANEPATKAYVDKIDWFGVGTAIPANSDLNNYTINGKYYCGNDSTAKTLLNSPTTSNFALYVFDRTGSGTVTHLLITLTGRMFMRGKSSSGWRDWVDFTRRSDISKDMMPGTEYRTLERSAGKAVYAKKVVHEFTDEFGDPNGSSVKDYTMSHGIENIDKLVRYAASASDNQILPYFSATGGCIYVKSVDETNIHIRCYKAARAVPITLEVDLFYTKTE